MNDEPLIFDVSKLNRSELEAEVVFQAKLLNKVRQAMLWTEELEDEGDRVYFASTNHADYQKAIFAEISQLELERAIFPSSGDDLYERLRVIREERDQLIDIMTSVWKMMLCNAAVPVKAHDDDIDRCISEWGGSILRRSDGHAGSTRSHLAHDRSRWSVCEGCTCCQR